MENKYSIVRVCGSDALEKKFDCLYTSLKRYKPQKNMGMAY